MRRTRVAAVSGLSLAVLCATLVPSLCCARRLGSLRPAPGVAGRQAAPDPRAVEMTFLGVAGWLMRRGDDAILTAPFFTNPGLLQVSLGRIASDEDAVDRHMPDASAVSAILVGHAHYDHLMDVPRVALRHAPKATVYGSDTTKHILAAVPELRGRVESVEDRAADGAKPGTWIEAVPGRLRFMAVRSEHAPHVAGIKMYGGSLDHDVDRLPRRAGGWKEGQTLAYVIDFLGADGRVDVRIHFQDSASNAGVGFPPEFAEPDRAPFQAVIFTGASFAQVDGYPEELLKKLAPRQAFVSHWEDFFIPPDAPLKVVRASNIAKLVRRLEQAKLPAGGELLLAKPGATYVVAAR